MEILKFPEADTPYDLRAQVLEIQDQAWPPAQPRPEGDATATHDPRLRPLSLLAVERGAVVVAALDILRKELVHDGVTYAAGGLSTVATRRESRGRGYGRRLVVAARAAMGELGLDIGLFTCDRELQPFYESAGWEAVDGAVVVGGTADDPFPSDQPGFDKVTMAGSFTVPGERAREAFRGRRIELHPGNIDKLW
ncbi:GNAT family N-acetyltransferase [Streptomyces sp. NPDC059009]|uniref:GNAT family N-acetyltransferase n=1 Tax=Streptomyces sp. NPDC059009 TaxID=3346694 RepID=UPI00367C83BE